MAEPLRNIQHNVDNQTETDPALVALGLYRLIAFNLTFSNVMGNSTVGEDWDIMYIPPHYLDTWDGNVSPII